MHPTKFDPFVFSREYLYIFEVQAEETMERYMAFRSPWSRRLSVSTLGFIVVLFVVSTIGRSGLHRAGFLETFMVTGVPLILASGSSLFVIRGYIITHETLFIQRFFWHSRVDLTGLTSCEIDPEAMSGSVRFGNGGLFCIVGFFHNDRLGNYRAYATDPKLAVILRFPDKIVVVTPDNPEQFVAALKEIVGA